MKQKRNCSSKMRVCSENMYIAIWDTLAPRVKANIHKHKKDFATNGPALLYFLLCKFTGEQHSVLCVTLAKFNNLKDVFRSAHHYNVDKFAAYVFALQTKLKECE